MCVEPLDKRYLKGIKTKNTKMIKLNKLGIDYYIFGMIIKEVEDIVAHNEFIDLRKGCSYIQFFPVNKNYTFVILYNELAETICYKFYITLKNFVDERGLPFYEKTSLSIIVDENLSIKELGTDKVNEELNRGKITKEQYDLIFKEAETIKSNLKENIQYLQNLSKKYYDIFFEKSDRKELDIRNTIRANIKTGMKVAIVLKKDQKTGILTEGIVKDILTNSALHHRGIKVRLMDGQVGRIQKIL